jgi:hypothetical protein
LRVRGRKIFVIYATLSYKKRGEDVVAGEEPYWPATSTVVTVVLLSPASRSRAEGLSILREVFWGGRGSVVRERSGVGGGLYSRRRAAGRVRGGGIGQWWSAWEDVGQRGSFC